MLSKRQFFSFVLRVLHCYVPAGGHGVRQSHRQDNLESYSSQPTRVVCVNHLFH